VNILGMGPLEILVIALIAFIFLGPERMSDVVRLLGKAVREGRNIASTIPRVVVEDDDIKVVERGRSTSLINDGPSTTPEPEPEPQTPKEDDGPVPFSRSGTSPAKPDSTDSSRTDSPPQ